MLSWNVRGLNKRARIKEVGVHLKKLQVSFAILVETRVKEDNKDYVTNKLGVFGVTWIIIMTIPMAVSGFSGTPRYGM